MNKTEVFYELEQAVYAALETYSNVHRGSGHNSMVTTHLFEHARTIVLEYLGLKKGKYVVIFCTKRGSKALKSKIKTKYYQSISSEKIGLPLGVWALAVDRKALPGGAPFQAGGGTARLVSPDWIVWDNAPDRFEAGTPAIINIIAFARALCLILQSGNEIFRNPATENLTASEILYHDDLEKFSGKELLDELRKTMIGSGVRVPTVNGVRPYINLDNSASTPTFTPVWNAVRQTWRQPGEIHEEIIHEVKSICSKAFGAPMSEYDVIFTSNTTEAINLAAESLSRESGLDTEPVVLTTLLEHSSNDLPWRLVSSSLIRLSINNEGFVDLSEMDTILSEYNHKSLYGNKRIKIVAISSASNVLGVYNNLEEISRIVHRYGARLLVDAAQMVAHRKIEMEQSGIDYLAFSAHKVYAPFGTGALLVRKGLLNFSPDELQQIKSSGEENVGGIAALGKALVLLQRIGMDLIREEEQVLTKHLLICLLQIPGITIYGIKDPDSPSFTQKGGVILFGLKGIMANNIAEELAIQGGIGIRYGCHCAHILIKHLLGVGPLLQRFQRIIVILFPGLRLPGLARVSLGIGNTVEDVDTFIHLLGKIAGKTGALPHKPSDPLQKVTQTLPKSVVKKQIKGFIRAASLRVYSQ
jgi:selenocysteine lyase/cysteine desulfurase